MQRKWTQQRSPAEPDTSPTTRLVSELEARGVAPSYALPVAQHLAAGEDLRGGRRDAVLEGVAAAFAAHAIDYAELEQSTRNIEEIQRLMGGFAGELRKLEEGLRIVSAYVLRMHDKANSDASKRIH